MDYQREIYTKTTVIFFSILLFSFIGWHLSDSLISYFISLSNYQLITTEPFEMLNVRFSLSLLVGITLSLPLMYLETYRFIVPALFDKERKVILFSTLPLFVMGLVGFLFALVVFIPSVLKYLNVFYIDEVTNTVTMNSYFGFVLTSLVVFGLVFCMPVLAGVLSYLGLINYRTMQKYQKHAILVIIIFGTFITPDPFIFTCLVVSLPLILLYEGSIIITYLISRSNSKCQSKSISINETL